VKARQKPKTKAKDENLDLQNVSWNKSKGHKQDLEAKSNKKKHKTRAK
jgi:hypothetical protein